MCIVIILDLTSLAGTTYALGVETGVDFFPNLVGILGETGAASVESTAAAF